MALLIYNTYAIFSDMSKGIVHEDFIININVLRALIIFVIAGHVIPVIWSFSFRKAV